MKRPVILSKHKSVRIDCRTIILVDRSVPDDVARKHFLDSISRTAPVAKNVGKKEEISDVIDDEIEEEIELIEGVKEESEEEE